MSFRTSRFVLALGLAVNLAPGFSALAQDSVTITLGASNTEQGLFLKEPEGAATTVVTKGGSAARSTQPPAGKTGGYMCFATDPAFAKDGNIETLFVTVEYFDEGTDQFRIEYDAQPDPANPNPDTDPFTVAQGGAAMAKYDTKKWVTYQFRLATVYFGKRQPGGADFRINDLTMDASGNPVGGEAPETIRKIVVSKTEPIPLHIKFTTTPVKLDGALDDPAWKEAQVFKVDQAAQDVIRPSRWKGTNDYSLDARFAWDNTALYLSYDVNDDVPRANTDVPGTSWNGDGAEVYIGFDQSKPGRSSYLVDTDFQITMSAGPNPTWAIFQNGAVLWQPEDRGPFQPADNIVVKDRAKGYVLEARIPWAMLVGPNGLTNKPPVPGQLIGFNVFANDGDNPDAPAQEKAMGFTGRPQAYRNPGAWATVQMDPPTPAVRPNMAISRQTDGKLRIGWPTQASGFNLQQASSVLGPWTAVAATIAVQGDQNYVLIQPQASPAFYRLAQ